jgi:hypothetical protein
MKAGEQAEWYEEVCAHIFMHRYTCACVISCDEAWNLHYIAHGMYYIDWARMLRVSPLSSNRITNAFDVDFVRSRYGCAFNSSC